MVKSSRPMTLSKDIIIVVVIIIINCYYCCHMPVADG